MKAKDNIQHQSQTKQQQSKIILYKPIRNCDELVHGEIQNGAFFGCRAQLGVESLVH